MDPEVLRRQHDQGVERLLRMRRLRPVPVMRLGVLSQRRELFHSPIQRQLPGAGHGSMNECWGNCTTSGNCCNFSVPTRCRTCDPSGNCNMRVRLFLDEGFLLLPRQLPQDVEDRLQPQGRCAPHAPQIITSRTATVPRCRRQGRVRRAANVTATAPGVSAARRRPATHRAIAPNVPPATCSRRTTSAFPRIARSCQHRRAFSAPSTTAPTPPTTVTCAPLVTTTRGVSAFPRGATHTFTFPVRYAT